MATTRVAVPPHVSSSMVCRSVDLTMPSESCIRRAALSLYITIIFLTQERTALRGPCGRFASLDSSPMVGFDWLWSEYIEIPDDAILTLLDLFCDFQVAVDVNVKDTEAKQCLVADTGAGWGLHDVEESVDHIAGARKFR